MKPNLMTTLLALGSLAIGTGPARAQEAPPKPAEAPPPAEATKPAEPKPEERGRPRPTEDRHDNERGRKHRDAEHHERGTPNAEHRGPRGEMKPTSYIGVLTRPLAPDVRAQAGLAEGFGLIIEEVMQDSPAQKAGLQQHDVLVQLGDQRLVNQEQLSALVRAEKKDSDVTFTIKRAGAEQRVTVKVGEKMMPVGMDRDDRPFGWFAPFGDRENVERFQQQLRQGSEQFQRGVREFQEHMKDWTRGPKEVPQPQPPSFRGDRRDGDPRGSNSPRREPGPRGGERPRGDQIDRGPSPQGNRPPPSDDLKRSNAREDFQRNVVRRDRDGEYTLSEKNGAKVFTVKPASGEEQSFIVNTEDQRQAVPERYRAKLKELENAGSRVPGETPPAPERKDKPGI